MDVVSKPLSELRAEYWMIQKLGVGGFGKVYLIRNRKTRLFYAAKHQKWCGQETPKNARREALALRKLSKHRNVVAFQDYFEGEEQSVLLMEYVQGGELFQRIASKDYKLTEAKCRDFFRQILKGVEFIHSRKIVHLDLKPQNIVMVTPFGAQQEQPANHESSEAGPVLSSSSSSSLGSLRRTSAPPSDDLSRLKIIDFGLARDLGPYSSSMPITMCGTLEFMSPEVMRCAHMSCLSDMWSVGVILYMMLSGGLSPFWAGSEYRTQRRIVRGIYTLDHPNFGDISRAALDCIERLLDTDDERRMTASSCLEHQWLTGSYLDTLKELETTWMRKYLAKRRWHRWFNAVKAMNRMQSLIAINVDNNIGLATPCSPILPKERWV